MSKYDTLKFVSIGISHWETPLDLRGQFSFTEAQMQLIIEEAKENGCTGIFIVSTCNRSQLFAHTSNTFMLKEIFYKHVNVNRDVIDKHIFLLSGDEAVHHLFELCSGLDSLMLGDLQIISQVKDAVHFSEKLNGIDGYIHRLMQYVLQSYKTVSTDTDINKGPASVAHAAVLFIKERFPQIHDKKMLLFGLGEIGETTLKNLYENYKTGRITIINRTKSKAEALAKGMNIRVADMSELNEEVELADIVIVATGAQTPTLQLDDLSNAITAEKKLLLDLSVPRNIDPKIDELCNIDLIDMDKLNSIQDDTLSMRRKNIPKARTIINLHKNEFYDWLKMRELSPVIQALRTKLHGIREHEVDLQKNRLTAEELAKADKLAASIVNKIANQSIEFLKTHFRQADDVVPLIEEMFQLKK
mgnify:CR=1 FL=1